MAKKQQRPHPRACARESRIAMLDNMRCPNGHRRVYLRAGEHRGEVFLEAECMECHAQQKVTAEDVARCD